MKTAKFGGTSLADAARFRQVKRIVSADPELRFVVVSAPGKRSAEDKKVTALLYDCHAAVKTGTDPETAFAPVAYLADNDRGKLFTACVAQLARFRAQLERDRQHAVAVALDEDPHIFIICFIHCLHLLKAHPRSG